MEEDDHPGLIGQSITANDLVDAAIRLVADVLLSPRRRTMIVGDRMPKGHRITSAPPFVFVYDRYRHVRDALEPIYEVFCELSMPFLALAMQDRDF